MRRATEHVVNEIAQGLRTLDDGPAWFSGLSPADRRDVLQQVSGYAMQAHLTPADGRAGVTRSGVKPTADPAVMICMDPPRYAFWGLPADEHVKAFRVLVRVFAVADARRRETSCKGTCGHSWHHLPPAIGPASGGMFRKGRRRAEAGSRGLCRRGDHGSGLLLLVLRGDRSGGAGTWPAARPARMRSASSAHLHHPGA
ncbi:DUF5958 family protein [Streptomyces sp. WAC06614]|uniref:DUF5958 family protein n=1 Tax=Streptomyces sp. WAC06614 TaxID=2487416 RepID=UPI0034D971A0